MVCGTPSFNQVKSYVNHNPDNVKARYILGKMYLKKGDLQDTLKHWKYIVRKRPNLWKVYYKIGMVEYKIGQTKDNTREKMRFYKKAMRVWKHLVQSEESGKDGQRARNAYLKVKAKYVKLSNASGAHAPVESIVDTGEYSQTELKTMEEKALKLNEEGEYIAATKIYEILYKNKFNEQKSLYNLGKTVLMEAEEPDKAVKYFKAYGRKYGNNARLLKNLGQSYGLCADTRNKIICYRKGIEIAKDNQKAELHFLLALSYDELGDKHSKTIEHAQQAVQLNPDYKKKLQPLIKNSNLAQDIGSIVDEVLNETEDSQLTDEQINQFARRVGDILGEENIASGRSTMRNMAGDKDKMKELQDTLSGKRRRSY